LVKTDDVIQTTNATAATSTTTGAFVVTGGAGIGGKLYVGGLANNTSSYVVYYNTATGELGYGINIRIKPILSNDRANLNMLIVVKSDAKIIILILVPKFSLNS
jgi:hypothetical protein